MIKNGKDLLDHGTLKSGVSHKWFDELSRLVEWFLLVDGDWIIFGLTTNIFGIFDMCWMSTAVLLIKNVLLLVPTGKILELDFPQMLLINPWLSVERCNNIEKIWEMTRILGVYPA